MIVTLVIGLPGSGKSTWLNKANGLVFDDIKFLGSLPKEPKLDIFISDISFCYPKTLQMAEAILRNKYPGCEIRKFYFENNVEKCFANVTRRNDGRKITKQFIEHLSKMYQIPTDADVIKVFSK